MNESKLAVVVYTDGGARPNPGHAGWGAHGYVYSREGMQKSLTKTKNNIITANGYKKIAPEPEDEPEIPIDLLHYIDFFGAMDGEATNNAAEVTAILKVLQHFSNESALIKIIIFTDSDYARKGVLVGIPIWKKKDWKKSDGAFISNINEWKKIAELLEYYAMKDINIEIHWVKGHSENYGNHLADLLATIGICYSKEQLYQSIFTTTPAKNYSKVVIERHPFISHRRLYFNSGKEGHLPGEYFLADPGHLDAAIGRRLPDASYSLIRLRKPDDIIEILINRQCTLAQITNAIILLRIDKIYQPDIYKYIVEYGGYVAIKESKNSLGLNFIDGTQLTIEQNPPGLCLRAVEHSAMLNELLNCYIANKINTQPPDAVSFLKEYHDVTSFFYDEIEIINNKKIKETKVVLKSEFGTASKEVIINLTIKDNNSPCNIAIHLLFGIDLLSRNAMKKIEDRDPKIHIITWKESLSSYKYCTIIEVNDAIGIWSNFFSSQVFKKDKPK